jgi:hypothetical protein
MSDIIDESIDRTSRTEIDNIAEVQPLPQDPMTDVSSKTIPATGAATSAAFLVANWLVGEGEG